MEVKNYLTISALVSLFLLILSLFIPFIPCKLAPKVPNPTYSWSLCSLDPENYFLSNSFIKFFGMISSIRMTYLILIILSFSICFILNYLISHKLRRKNK